MTIYFSECCGVELTGEMLDIGLCRKCQEHCHIVAVDDDEDDRDGDYTYGWDDGECPEDGDDGFYDPE